jgi:hypothetical protein
MLDYLDSLTIDWKEFESAASKSREIVKEISRDKKTLRMLCDRVETDPGLQALCERHQLLDYLVLYEALDRGFRLRLHLSTEDHFDRPHDHRFSFSSYIMAGSYIHTWYKPLPELYKCKDEELLDFSDYDHPDTVTSIDISKCQPFLTRTESSGNCYSLHSSALHTTFTTPDTVSLFLRGPVEKRRSAIIDLQTRRLWWRFGREEERSQRRSAKVMPLTYIRELRGRLERLNIL